MRESKKKKLLSYDIYIILTLFLSLCLLSLYSLFLGEANVGIIDYVNSLFYERNNYVCNVLNDIRLPRVVGSIVVGASLALSGVLLQVIIKNPLASPSTLGINNASVFGANVALILLPMFGVSFNYLTSFTSFFFALLTQVVFLLIIKYKSHKSHILILLGVAFSSLYHAGTMLMQTFAEDNVLATAVFWSFGDLGRINYNEIYIITAILILSSIVLLRHLWDLNCLFLGESDAISLGVNVSRSYAVCIIISCLTASVAVSFVGLIGFIGLIAPQLSRMIITSKMQYYLPTTCLLGSNLLLLSDIIARSLTSTTIPVGIITSFFGAPVIIYLILREAK